MSASRSPLSRHRGLLALLLAAVGWAMTLVLAHEGTFAGPALTVLRHVFEGAMVGGIADWFAVRALFRRIPIPLLQRHTNIIARNRPRLTEGIVDMVQNQWLAPAVIRERLQHVSLSRMAVDTLRQPEVRLRALAYGRTVLRHAAQTLDSPILVRFVGDVVTRQLQALDLHAVLLRPLAATLRDDTAYEQLWLGFVNSVRRCLKDADVRVMLHDALEKLIGDYLQEERSKGVLSGTWAKIKLWVGMPGREEREQWLADRLDTFDLYLQRQSAGEHQLRHTVRDKLLTLLEAPDNELGLALLKQQGRLVERLRHSEIFHTLLVQARQNCLEQLDDPGSPLCRWLEHLLDDSVEGVAASPELQARIDRSVSELVVSLVEQNPDAIGATVRYALSPARLSDEQLIRQIEDKVGDDLEWIRVNGALVGGLVAGLLGAAQLWL